MNISYVLFNIGDNFISPEKETDPLPSGFPFPPVILHVLPSVMSTADKDIATRTERGRVGCEPRNDSTQFVWPS